MSRFNTTEIKSIDDIIQEHQRNATALMCKDIAEILYESDYFLIELNSNCYIDGDATDDYCYEVYLDKDEVMLACYNGNRNICDLDYEQLHTLYEALQFEGRFKE